MPSVVPVGLQVPIAGTKGGRRGWVRERGGEEVRHSVTCCESRGGGLGEERSVSERVCDQDVSNPVPTCHGLKLGHCAGVLPSTHVTLQRPTASSLVNTHLDLSAAPAPAAPPEVRMRAEWDYVAISQDELSIRKGDRLVVLGDGPDPGWLLAELTAPLQDSQGVAGNLVENGKCVG